jgi:WS/DGAT/MGAT family acyltransferase
MALVDAAWLDMEEPGNLMMITAVLWFDEKVDWARLRTVVEERLVDTFPRFRQRVVRPAMGMPEWVDETVDLDWHLRHDTLPAPGDRVALQRRVSELMSMPLDMRRPLWQLHLVEGLGGGGSAVVARFHHAMADGIALARVLLTLTDGQGDPAQLEQQHPHPRKRKRPLMSQLRRAVWKTQAAVQLGADFLATPQRIAEAAKVTTDGALTLAKILAMPSDPHTPLRGELGVEKLAAWSDPVPLDLVKARGKAMGGTINDVVMAAVAGALRRYLQSRGGEVPQRVRACIPVNLRPLDKPLPRELGNRFGLVFLELPIGQDDAKARMSELKQRMDALKKSPQAVVTYGVLNAMALAPERLERALIDLVGSKASLVLTNVPGPKQPVYLAGAKLAGMVFWVPQSGHLGLGVSIFSYAGQLVVGVAVDAGLVPDPQRLVAELNAELATAER